MIKHSFYLETGPELPSNQPESFHPNGKERKRRQKNNYSQGTGSRNWPEDS